MDETATPGQDLDDIVIQLNQERVALDRLRNRVRVYQGLSQINDPTVNGLIYQYEMLEQDYARRLSGYVNQRARTSETRTTPEPPGMDTSYLRGEGSLTVNPEGYGIPDTETAE